MRVLAVLALALGGAAAAEVPEPDGYRTDDFRAPVPPSLRGATVVSSEEAASLWAAGWAVFIDVMPRPPKPGNLPEGTIWRDRPHDSIPGAIWLPNVGYGALDPASDARFRDALAAATGRDPGRPLVFFCLADCWMSWNAARRAALEYGYTAVHWFPDGVDGWTFEGLPLERVEPAE